MVKKRGNAPVTLPPSALPTLGQMTRRASHVYQYLTKWLLRIALLLLAFSAFTSPFHSLNKTVIVKGWTVNIATGLAALAFTAVFAIRLIRLRTEPERRWYDSRGLTEEIRSLTWQYAAGGIPFAKSRDPEPATETQDASQRFEQVLARLTDEARQRHVPLRKTKKGRPIQTISPWMAQTRDKQLSDRVQTYRELRIHSQQRFYGDRNEQYTRAAWCWNVALILFELAAAALAGLHALSLIQVDLVGIAGTLISAGTAWLQFNQYSTLAASYGTMDLKLAAYDRQARETVWDDARWARFVREVEDLLGMEHSSWRLTVETTVES